MTQPRDKVRVLLLALLEAQTIADDSASYFRRSEEAGMFLDQGRTIALLIAECHRYLDDPIAFERVSRAWSLMPGMIVHVNQDITLRMPPQESPGARVEVVYNEPRRRATPG